MHLIVNLIKPNQIPQSIVDLTRTRKIASIYSTPNGMIGSRIVLKNKTRWKIKNLLYILGKNLDFLEIEILVQLLPF